MTALRYNPLTYSEKLKKSGLSETSANVIAQEQAEIVSNMLNNEMATKSDIASILKCMAIVQNDIKTMEYKIIIKLGAMMLGMVGLLTFLIKST